VTISALANRRVNLPQSARFPAPLADWLDLRQAMGITIVLMIAGLTALINASAYGGLAAACVALGRAAAHLNGPAVDRPHLRSHGQL
jgi:hypothetical protein